MSEFIDTTQRVNGMKKSLASVRVIISGHVQGVSFRAFVQDVALSLTLSGYALNLPDGVSVEVFAEGEKKSLVMLLEYLKVGPPGARVREVKTEWSVCTGEHRGFTIK